jgi:hypothetical protein
MTFQLLYSEFLIYMTKIRFLLSVYTRFRLLGWQINAGKFSAGQFLRKADKCFGVCIVN